VYKGLFLLKGNISASFVQLLFDWLAQRGQSGHDVLGMAAPPVGELSRLDVNQWKAMLTCVAQRFAVPDLGLQVGSRLGRHEAGLLGYMASCCSSMAEACLRLSQFEHLMYNVNPLKIVTQPDAVALCWGVENGKPGPLVDECAIAGLVSFCRSLGGPAATPQAVWFVNPEPTDRSPYDDFFACELLFNMPQTRVCYPLTAMALPIATANPELQAALDHKAKGLLLRLPTDGEPVPGLYRALQDAVSAGSPTLQSTADRLLTSPRSLQRALQSAQTSFQQQLDTVRMAMAQQHLREGSASIQEIAWMLAYNDHSAFVHFFRRVAGQTPQHYRTQQGHANQYATKPH
jgi:AraC-like DNA-binding protein